MIAPMPSTGIATPSGHSRYAAPALEKGLDILEALAAEPEGLSQQVLAARLGRTVGEIFRMLEVLVRRGYVVRDAASARYALSLKLFDLSHRHPPTRRLLEAALPEMRRLADATRQSVHLSVRNGSQLLVLAQVEGFADMGFSVRPGSSYPFRADRTSARVLAAFAAPEESTALAAMLGRGTAGGLARIRAAGVLKIPSDTIAGVTDVCAPVHDASGAAVAALNLTWLARRGEVRGAKGAVGAVRGAAEAVSHALGWRPG
jgi:DNA-binding IclR family transcriptional regulator